MSKPSRRRTPTTGDAMSSAAGSPARTSVLPGSGPGLPASDLASGGNSHGSFAYFDHDLLWWRTYQGCLLPSMTENKQPSDAFSASWPASGMTQSGKAYRRSPLVPLRRGIGPSSSPTLRATETDQGEYQSSGGKDLLTLKGLVKVLAGHPVSDRTRAAATPTLTAQDAKNSTFPESQRLRDSLIGYLMRATPTLVASAGDRGGRGELTHFMKCGKPQGRITPSLNAASGDNGPRKKATKAENGGHQVNLIDVTAHLSGRGGGVLNPRWCEWYMGFPVGWCDLPSEDSATVSCPK